METPELWRRVGGALPAYQRHEQLDGPPWAARFSSLPQSRILPVIAVPGLLSFSSRLIVVVGAERVEEEGSSEEDSSRKASLLQSSASRCRGRCRQGELWVLAIAGFWSCHHGVCYESVCHQGVCRQSVCRQSVCHQCVRHQGACHRSVCYQVGPSVGRSVGWQYDASGASGSRQALEAAASFGGQEALETTVHNSALDSVRWKAWMSGSA